MVGSIMKRLEALERSITFRRSRMIVYEAHADTAASEHEAFLKEIAAGDADLVVCVSRFGPEPMSPRLVSITPL
jgi:DNA-binding GntR family transcriptional regulator